MKNRIISTLLLLAMLVTAVPLAAFAVLAADLDAGEAPAGVEYEADDYNALYVQDGLLYAIDFYSSNSYWKGSAATVDLTAFNAYAWKKNGITLKSGDTSVTVGDGYATSANKLPDLIIQNSNSKSNKGQDGATLELVSESSAIGGTAFLLDDVRVGATTSEGNLYLRSVYLRNDHGVPMLGDGTLMPTNTNLCAIPLTDGARTWVMTLDTPVYTQTYYTIDYSASCIYVRPTVDQLKGHATSKDVTDGVTDYQKTFDRLMIAGSNSFYVTHTEDGVALEKATAYLFSAYVPKTVEIDGEVYVYGATHRRDTNTGISGTFFHNEPTHFTLGMNGEVYFDRDDLHFPDNDNLTGDCYVNLWGGHKQDAFYGTRLYGRVLTPEQSAQNHLADLLKFFRLDLGYINLLDAAELAELAVLAKDLKVSDSYETVANTLLPAAKAAAEEKYAGTLGTDIFAVIVKYGLDRDPLDSFPYYMIPKTYSFVVSGYRSCADLAAVQAGYLAAINGDLAAMGEGFGWDRADYDSLLASPEDLLYAIDFFRYNEYWNDSVEHPAPLTEWTNYHYDIDLDGVVDPGETYDFSDRTDRMVSAKHSLYAVYRDKAVLAEGETRVDTRTYYCGEVESAPSFDGTFLTYETAEAAQAVADALTTAADASGDYTYGIVRKGGVLVDWKTNIPNTTASNGRLHSSRTKAAATTWVIFMTAANGQEAVYSNDKTTVAHYELDPTDTEDGRTYKYVGYANDNTKAFFNCGGAANVITFDSEYEAELAAADLRTQTSNPITVQPYPGASAYTGCTPAFEEAIINYRTQVLNFFASHVTVSTATKISGLGLSLPAAGVLSYHDAGGAWIKNQLSVVGDGYLQQEQPRHSNSYLTLGHKSGNDWMSAAAMEVVMAAGTTNAGSSTKPVQFPTLRNIALGVYVSGGKAVLSMTPSYGNTTGIEFDDVTLSSEASEVFSVVINDEITGGLGDHTVGIIANGKTVIEGETTTAESGKTVSNHNTLINYGSGAISQRYYAVRMYDRNLTEADTVKNRFADLAKFFRLDLSGIEALDDLTPLYEATADFSITGSTRYEVQKAVTAVLLELAPEAYRAEYDAYLEKGFTADEVDTARLFALDLEPLTKLPRAVYPTAWATLATLCTEKRTAPDFAGAADRLAAAIDADIAATGEAKFSVDKYNELYVQDGLFHATDMFLLNPWWNETIEYPLPVGPGENDAYSYDYDKDGTPESYDLKNSTEYHIGYVIQTTDNGTTTTGTEIYTVTEAAEKIAELSAADTAAGKTGVTYEAVVKDMHPVYAAAHAEWVTATNLYYGQFAWYRRAKTERLSQWYISNQIRNTTYSVATKLGFTKQAVRDFEEGAGFLKLTNGFHSNGGMQFEGLGATDNWSKNQQDFTMTIVGAPGLMNSAYIIFYNIRPSTAVGTATDTKYISGIGSGFTVDATAEGSVISKTNIPVNGTGVVDLTYSIHDASLDSTDASKQDVFTVRTPDETLYKAIGQWTRNNSFYYGWSHTNTGATVYAVRNYDRALEESELRQNHFADLAKFFRLDLGQYEALPAEYRGIVIDEMVDVQLDADRTDVLIAYQLALGKVYDALATLLAEDYPELDAEYPTLFATVAEYRLAIQPFLDATRDMSYAYATLTDGSITGMSWAAAEAFTAELYHDTYYYRSYWRDGEESGEGSFNGLLTALMTAAPHLNAEALMALPHSDRVAFAASGELTQTAINEFVAERMDVYGASELTLEAYDALYVKDGLVFAMDFFKTNRYWNPNGEVDYSVPVGPSYDSRFWEDTNGDGICDANEMKLSAVFTGGAAQTAYTQEFIDAIDAWERADKAYLAGFETVESNMYVHTYKYSNYKNYSDSNKSNYTTLNASKYFSTYMLGDGYLQLRADGHTSGGFTFEGAASSAIVSDNLTQQVISVIPETRGDVLTLHYNARPIINRTGNEVVVSGMKSGQHFSKDVVVVESKPLLVDGTATDLTMTLTGVASKAGNNVFTVRTEDGSFVNITGTYGKMVDTDGDKVTDTWSYNADGTEYINYGNSYAAKLYAYRHYNQELTQEGILQNHFADLAKFFRLEIASYNRLTDAEKAAVHVAMKDYDLATSSREAVQAAYTAAMFGGDYENARTNDLLPDAFLDIAELLQLDIAPLLAIREDASRVAITAAVTDDFTVGYSLNAQVIDYVLGQEMAFLDALVFEGMRVRLDSGYDAEDLLEVPGLRACFIVNDALVTEDITAFGVQILNASGEIRATICFTPVWNEGELSFVGTSTVTGKEPTDAAINKGEDGTHDFAYTVIYKGDAAQTKEMYEYEMSYHFFVERDGNTYTRDIVSDNFGDKISAAEVYSFFKTKEVEYDVVDDDVIAKVVATLTAE